MKLAYVAANYFIEVIFKSPSFTISFDNLMMFRKLIAKDVCPVVAEYLDKESQDDFLFLFRKFPDVFLLRPNMITFTDTFIFLIDHLDSYEFNINGARDIRTVLYLETFAVGYFSHYLKCFGPQDYFFLFKMIINDKTNPFSLYFQLHNAFDAQIFFEAHADVFLMCKGIVSLREEKLVLTNPLLSKSLAPNVMGLFEDSVYFLLTCFESLHYIELRQCVCYAFASVKNILNRFPIIKQREVFEILPHVNMTELGYLSLKQINVKISHTSLDKTILFIVCLLAFRQTMHYEHIIKEVNTKLPSTSNCLKGLAKTELVQFFNNFSALFRISPEGYIALLPTFVFPVFTTEILYNPQNDHDASKPVDIPQSDRSTSKPAISNADAKSLTDNDSVQLQVSPVQNDKLSLIDDNCKYFLYTLTLTENNNKQVRLSILFLVNYFHPVDKQCVFITLFHVMEEVRNSFCNLSTSDRRSFISYCCQFINALSDHLSEECILARKFEGMERLLLSIAYLLTSQKEMHFEKIVKSLEEKKIDNPISSLSVSEQYKYFQKKKKFLKMESNGYVSLAPPFELIKKNVDTYNNFLSKNCCTTYSEMVKDTRRKDRVSKAEISVTVSEILNCSLPVTGNKVPLDVRKILLTAHHLVKKHVKATVLQRIFEASVFILEDLKKCVYNLSMNKRNDFVNECHQFMLKARSFKKTLKQDVFCVVDISTEERDNLFIAYLLTGKKISNHVQTIIDKLRKYGVCKSLTSKNAKDQFKYFKETSQYFIINSDGYITFQSSFNHLKLIIGIGPISENGFLKEQKKRGEAGCSKRNPIEYQIKHIKIPTEKNYVIDSSSSEAVNNSDNDLERENTIIDLCVFILSSTKKIPVEKLCHRVNACKVKNIEDFFTLFTVYEKAKFFKDLSEYFEVSPDNFVSLKENVVETYVPKTNLDHSELRGKSNPDYKEMPERSPSTSDSAVFSDVSELSESSSASFNNLRKKKKEPRVKKKSQSMSDKKKNAAVGKTNKKSSKPLTYSISVPHGLNNEIVESKIFWNSSLKQEPFKNISASSSDRDVPSNPLKSEKSSDISKASESATVNSEQPCKKKLQHKDLGELLTLSQNSCNGEDGNLASSASNIASGSSNFPVSNRTSDPRTKNASEINSVCAMQKENLSDMEGTKISKAESKLANGTISVLKQNNSHETVNCRKNLNTRSEEMSSELDTDYANNASNFVKKTSEENACSDYCSISNYKSNPGNKKPISDKETKNLSLSASSSELPSKHTEDSSAEIVSNINCAPIYKGGKARMPSQKSCVEMYLPTMTESTKALFKDEESSKTSYPSIHTCNKLRIQNNYNFSNNGMSYSSSIECYTSKIAVPEKSSVELHSNFSNASSAEESKSLDSRNILSRGTAVKVDCQSAEAVKSNWAGPKAQNSNYGDKSATVPKQSAIEFKDHNFDSIQEIRAVNFFCVVLGNYQKYHRGLSAEFLKKHLFQASGEVQAVIRDNYPNDFLSFFKKHKNEFYVSPQSQVIYLQKRK